MIGAGVLGRYRERRADIKKTDDVIVGLEAERRLDGRLGGRALPPMPAQQSFAR